MMESMKQPEYFAITAEAFVNQAREGNSPEVTANMLRAAQVYATLAVAAAIRKPLFKSE